jgi:hypothetical protein
VSAAAAGGGALLALGYGAGEEQAPVYLAHHALVIALPFVVPVFIVIAMVAVVAWRDRHRPADAGEPGADASDRESEADEAGSAAGQDRAQDTEAKDGALR